MRFNSLRFGKAISAALFVLLLVVGGSKNALAQNQAATLQHEGSITVFYGSNALSNAHAAAAIGDTITLSSGTFGGCTLSKPVKIHGAGCSSDTIAGILPSTISGSLVLNNHNDSLSISIEGLDCGTVYYDTSCKNINLKKCNISFFSKHYSTNINIYNLNLDNCIVKSFKYMGSGVTIVNSVLKITQFSASNSDIYNNTIYNSIIIVPSDQSLGNSTVINSIIAVGNSNYVSNSTFYNCIGIGSNSLFNNQVNSTNMLVNNYSDVFETFAGTVTYDNIYQLKVEFVNSFLGNDGTEVGIYGGMMPYCTRPSYMIIRHCNVAGRTTEDNKLSVEIELNTNE